jgi:hypothetical protein
MKEIQIEREGIPVPGTSVNQQEHKEYMASKRVKNIYQITKVSHLRKQQSSPSDTLEM